MIKLKDQVTPDKEKIGLMYYDEKTETFLVVGYHHASLDFRKEVMDETTANIWFDKYMKGEHET